MLAECVVNRFVDSKPLDWTSSLKLPDKREMKVLALIIGAVVLVQLFAGGEAEKGPCCLPKPGWSNGQVTLNCADCKAGTPYCGVGRCNLWGCNCDGGCRAGTCGGLLSAPEIFTIVDTNKDGRLSHAEAHDYLVNAGVDMEHLPPILAGPTPGAAPSHSEFLPEDIIVEDHSKYEMCQGHDAGQL